MNAAEAQTALTALNNLAALGFTLATAAALILTLTHLLRHE